MAKTPPPATPPEAVISIVGAGMSLDGDCETNGSLRIEGTIRGNVRAAKSVVIGKNGLVDGSIFTQDAVISGRVLGSVTAESRLELHSTSQISGEVYTLRLQLQILGVARKVADAEELTKLVAREKQKKKE